MTFELETTLRPLGLFTWSLPPERLASLLPAALLPQTVQLGGRRVALYSVAIMLQVRMAPRGWRIGRFTFAQLNERTYVTRADGTRAGAYFFRSSVSSWIAWVPRLIFGLPYFKRPLKLNIDAGKVEMTDAGRSQFALDPRSSVSAEQQELAAHLCPVIANPLVGYSLSRGKLVEFDVEHAPIVPQVVNATVAAVENLPFAQQLGVVGPPIETLYVAESRFTITMPPRKVR